MTYAEFNEILIQHVDNPFCPCRKEEYKGWEYTKGISIVLESKGGFDDGLINVKRSGYNQYHPNDTSYWSEDAPIVLNYYPYHDSEILRCKKCRAVFLTYMEHSGHAPERRLRWVQPDLVVCEM